MEENLLDVLWNAHFVDRHVKRALQEMFVTADRGLIRLIRRAAGKLSPKEIGESLRRLDLRVESLSPLPDTGVRDRGVATPSSRRTQPAKRKPRKPRTGPTASGVTLADIVASRLLMPPLKLFRKCKGKTLEATLLANGSVEFQGVPHASCSAVASMARSTITGQSMATNGWEFWQYLDGNGKKLTLADARNAFRTRGSRE
jgi:hypothetical protein